MQVQHIATASVATIEVFEVHAAQDTVIHLQITVHKVHVTVPTVQVTVHAVQLTSRPVWTGVCQRNAHQVQLTTLNDSIVAVDYQIPNG